MATPPGPSGPPPIRPVLVDVTDPRVTAPAMFLAWPGRPTLWNLGVRIRTPLRPPPTKREARQRALEELAAMTREQLGMLREVATAGPDFRSDEAFRMIFDHDRAARAAGGGR